MSLEQRNSNELHSVLIASVSSSRQPYFHLLVWWLIVSLFSFFLYIAWDLGHLRLIYERDRSYLTVVISLLAVFASVHAFYHIAQKLARQCS